MTRTRPGVWAIAALLSTALTACAQGDASLAGCIDQLRHELPAHPELRPESFDTYTHDVQDLRALIDEATRSQPEFQLQIWDYLARRTDAQRVAQGRELLAREARELDTIARRQGVDAATTVTVFGVETDYGRVGGTYPVVDATLSRACLNLKSAERKQHFFAALWLLQEGVVRRDDFKGSWAGAFGMTQFMPGTFARFMNDGAGTPAADIVHSVPDALATTARYLRGLGWTAGQAWGVEVKVPPALASANALEGDHACLQEAVLAGKCSKLAQWAAASVRRIDGAPLLAHDGGSGAWQATTPTALLMPAGPQGPAWLVTPNYQAIWRYNRADAYALAIGLLSDALRGGPPQRVAWPTDDPGLSRAEFREVQAGLLARGHCELRIDGAQGPRTSTAIREEEQRIGWPQTGRAGARLLAHLRSEHPGAVACPAPAAASAAASSVANMHQPSAAGAAK